MREWNDEETLMFMEEEDKLALTYFKSVKKIHEILNYKSAENLLHAYKNANILDDKIKKNVMRVVDSCKLCHKNEILLGSPNISLQKATDFNQIVTMDLLQWGPSIFCGWCVHLQDSLKVM